MSQDLWIILVHIAGLVQERRNSIAVAVEFCSGVTSFCTNPSKFIGQYMWLAYFVVVHCDGLLLSTLSWKRYIYSFECFAFSWSFVFHILQYRYIDINWATFNSWINFNPAFIRNNMPCKVWYEINYPFPNFNEYTVEVWEWIINFIP